MNQSNREQSITQLQGYLKGATITVHEIQELLLSQEHIIWMQQKEIDDLRKRLKELENLDLQNEQILYVQNINTQLKTQIEFLKSQIQEKDQLIVQFTLKPIQTPSSEIVAAQQQLIQQNLALQNIIGELQNQILNKDTVISQLKTQESRLDQVIGQLSNTIQNKRSQVGSAEKQIDIQNALNELQTYPDALQEIVERIIQEYKRLQFLMEEKDIENNNLRSRLQLQQQKANDSIQDILNKNQPSAVSLNRANDLVQQQATMEDIITDLERKLVSQEKRRKELQNQLFSIGQENFQLDKTKNDQNSNSVQQFSINQQIIPQQSEMSFQQDQVIELKTANYEQQVDTLVNENQQMDDLIVDLQKKLVEKQEQFESIQNEIEKIESNPIKIKYNELIIQIQSIQEQLQEKELELEQMKNKFKQTNDEEKQLISQIEEQSAILPILAGQLQGIKKVENLNIILEATQNDLLEKQRQLNIFEDECKQKKVNLEQLQQLTLEVQQQFEQEKSKLQEKEIKSQKADDLIQQILELDELISKLELKQAEKADQVNSLQQNLQNLQPKQESLEYEIQKKYQQNQQLESELKGLQQQQQKFNLEIEQTQEQLKNMSEQLNSLQKRKQELNEQNKKLQEINDQLDQENTNLEVLKEQLQQTVQSQQILEMNIDENTNTIQNLHSEIQNQQEKLERLNKQNKDLNEQLENLLTEKQNQEAKYKQLEQDLSRIDTQIENLHNQKEIKEKRLIDLIQQIDSIVLNDKEQLLKEKQKSEQQQNLIQEEIDRLKQRFEKIKQQQQNIEQLIENQTNFNQDMENDLIKQKFTGKELELELHSIQAQQQEMKFQIKEKTEDLDRLNEQFTKIDEESKMMEAVLQLKQKELKGIQQKKENFAKELDQISTEIFDLKKEINLRRKYQQQQNKVDFGQQNEDVEDEIEGKLQSLNLKNNNLKDDLQKLVELSPEPEEKQKQVDLSINDDKIQKALKDREKRIEILELTIQTLQNQQNSMLPIGLSKITQQPSFFVEEDPLLQELYEKFTKESELLVDLQNKLRKTAERHYELSVKLQEWAEKESRLANELEARTQCVERIELEIQQIFDKQTDLEFEKSSILSRIYQLENENQEFLETEATTKNRLKEKKDYIQVLYKNLVEMDQKLLQLRNRMALYSQEGRQLSELVENQENERENQKYNLQAVKEELEQIEIEVKEKQQLINQIKKEIQFDNEEKEKLEIQFINIHSKNAQLKEQIGLEETLYQKLLVDLEVQKKKDQVKFLNLFQECSTQTEYELDQFEMLSNEMQFYKITRDEITLLKQTCQQKIISIAQNDGQQQIAYNKEQLKTIVHLQQLLIQCQENENNYLIETNSRRSSKLGFKSIDESSTSQQFTLEQIDILFNKTSVVEVQLTEHCIFIGEYKLARQWIIDKQFDFQNNLYPLGVLNLIFKISIYQVVTITLTGSKVLQLYQQIL